jgi:[ribosomal protein S18]-alanine N-acetyltransferase
MITLRPALPEDRARLLEIALASRHAMTWVDGYPAFAALAGEVLAGFVLYRVVAGEGEILNLAIHPEWRRRGLGRALLREIWPLAGTWHLEVRPSNGEAIALYESLGMRVTGRRPKYYADGEDAVLMAANADSSS